MIRAGLAALAFAAAVPAAGAEPVEGLWSFETKIERKGCVITGKMVVEPTEDGTALSCQFVSRETCSGLEAPVDMEQSCTVTPEDEGYIIISRVRGALTKGYDMRFYAPDHFSVAPEGSGRMRGIWWDRNYSAPVVFWRDQSAPVS